MRVISGHLGWVRCVDVEPANEWFVTGAADRVIKVCPMLPGDTAYEQFSFVDLGSGQWYAEAIVDGSRVDGSRCGRQ